MKTKINLRNIIIYLGLFLILLYPFNATIDTVIYPNSLVCLISVIFGLFCLIITKNKGGIKKKTAVTFAITVVIILMTLINNYYIIERRTLRVALFTAYLFLPFVFCLNEDLEKPLYNMLVFFSLEHIIGTFLQLFFNGFYTNSILPIICEGKTSCTAIGNNYHGYMTGFTTFFSTNAIYLSISTLLFYSEMLKNKNKKSIALFILSIIALFTTGKRAHLIFTIFCCLIVYLALKSKNIIKKYFKLLFFVVLSIFAFILLSRFIPEMTNIISRFEALIDKGDIMNNRSGLYQLAFDMWDKHLLFGNGWGSFSYFYELYIHNPLLLSYLDAHNVFIQLLCEVGLVGFIIFSSIMLLSLFKSSILSKKDIETGTFIFSYQLFFLLYCFTGNPLYDPMSYVIYFALIGLTIIKNIKGDKV